MEGDGGAEAVDTEIVDTEDGVIDVVVEVAVLDTDIVDNNDAVEGARIIGDAMTVDGLSVTVTSVEGVVGELGVGVTSLSIISVAGSEGTEGDEGGEGGGEPRDDGSGIFLAVSISSGIVGTTDGAYRLATSSSISGSDGNTLIEGVGVRDEISSSKLGSCGADGVESILSTLGSLGSLISLGSLG